MKWHVLRAQGAAAAAALYADALGWRLGEHVALRPGESYRRLAFGHDESSFGVVGEVGAGVHPQWLFFFGVASIEVATERVRALGGVVVDEADSPEGVRYVVCEDPQGAAFGLVAS